jgi:hypothetical protein
VTAAAHLAEFEAAGPVAVRAHLQTEHANAVRALHDAWPASATWAFGWTHRVLHASGTRHPARTFPTEAPA